jgi:hypothetical protein
VHGFNHAAVGGAAAAVMLRWLQPLEVGQTGPAISEPAAWGLAAVVFVIGLATHALLDVVPHDDHVFPKWGEILLGVCSLGVCYLLSQGGYGWLIVVGAFGGTCPDLEHTPYEKGWLTRRFYPTHNDLLPHPESSRAFSLAVQLPLFAASLMVMAWWG